MKNSVLIAVGALLVGSAGGYFIGSAGEKEDETTQDEARRSKASRTTVRSGGSGGSGGQAAGKPAKSSRTLQDVMNEPGQTNRIMSLLQYYADLDPSEFEPEMQKLQGLAMSQRMLAMNLLFARWAETDPEAALAQSRTMGFPEMFMARAGVVSGWAASNPEGLARQYTENPSEFRMPGPGGRGGGDTVAMIAGEWAKQNPKAALAWARTLGDEAGDAVEGIFNELAQKDPEEALSMATGLSDEERMDAYRSIAESWAITDYDAADSWINTLSGEEKSIARVEAVEALAEIDPKRASVEALKVSDAEQRDRLVADVSQEWARENPTAALEFLTTKGGEDAVEDGIGRVIGRLANQDAGQAREWIDTQAEGPVRDNAVQGYVYGNRDAPPAETVTLAETISDEGRREETVRRVAYQWLRDDSEAALNYVESSATLSEGSKERLMEAAERMAEGGGGGDRPGGRGPRGR